VRLLGANKKQAMRTFKDLVFRPGFHFGKGVSAHFEFDNGCVISVQASRRHYCSPREDLNSPNDYESFEIAIWNEYGEWKTREFIPDLNDDVAPCMSREQIEKVMGKIQNEGL